jgi:hypothetical protein
MSRWTPNPINQHFAEYRRTSKSDHGYLFPLTLLSLDPSHPPILSLPLDGWGRASLHWLLQRLDLLGWNSLG